MSETPVLVGPRGAKGAGLIPGNGLPPTDQGVIAAARYALGSTWLNLDDGKLYGPLVRTGVGNDVTFGTDVLFDFGNLGGGGGDGGLTTDQVSALIATATAGLDTTAAVTQAIANAIAGLPASPTVSQVNAAIATALSPYENTAAVTQAITAALAAQHAQDVDAFNPTVPPVRQVRKIVDNPNVSMVNTSLHGVVTAESAAAEITADGVQPWIIPPRGPYTAADMRFYFDTGAGLQIGDIAYYVGGEGEIAPADGWPHGRGGYVPYILAYDLERDVWLDPVQIPAPAGAPVPPPDDPTIMYWIGTGTLEINWFGVTLADYGGVHWAGGVWPGEIDGVSYILTHVPDASFDPRFGPAALVGDVPAGDYSLWASVSVDAANPVLHLNSIPGLTANNSSVVSHSSSAGVDATSAGWAFEAGVYGVLEFPVPEAQQPHVAAVPDWNDGMPTFMLAMTLLSVPLADVRGKMVEIGNVPYLDNGHLYATSAVFLDHPAPEPGGPVLGLSAVSAGDEAGRQVVAANETVVGGICYLTLQVFNTDGVSNGNNAWKANVRKPTLDEINGLLTISDMVPRLTFGCGDSNLYDDGSGTPGVDGTAEWDADAGRKLMSYDPDTGEFATLADKPTGFDFGGFGVVGNLLYAVCKDYNAPGAPTFLDVYDPTTDSWTSADVTAAVAKFDSLVGFQFYDIQQGVPGAGAWGTSQLWFPDARVALMDLQNPTEPVSWQPLPAKPVWALGQGDDRPADSDDNALVVRGHDGLIHLFYGAGDGDSPGAPALGAVHLTLDDNIQVWRDAADYVAAPRYGGAAFQRRDGEWRFIGGGFDVKGSVVVPDVVTTDHGPALRDLTILTHHLDQEVAASGINVMVGFKPDSQSIYLNPGVWNFERLPRIESSGSSYYALTMPVKLLAGWGVWLRTVGDVHNVTGVEMALHKYPIPDDVPQAPQVQMVTNMVSGSMDARGTALWLRGGEGVAWDANHHMLKAAADGDYLFRLLITGAQA